MPELKIAEYLLSRPPTPVMRVADGRHENGNESYPHLDCWTTWPDFSYETMLKQLGPYLQITGNFHVPKTRESDRHFTVERGVDEVFSSWHKFIVNTAMDAIYEVDYQNWLSDPSKPPPCPIEMSYGARLKRNGDHFVPDWAGTICPDLDGRRILVPGDSKLTDVIFHESDFRVPVPDKEEGDSDPEHDRSPEEVELDYKYGCLEQVCAYAKAARTRYAFLVTPHQIVFVRVSRPPTGSPRSPVVLRRRPRVMAPQRTLTPADPDLLATPRPAAIARAPGPQAPTFNGPSNSNAESLTPKLTSDLSQTPTATSWFSDVSAALRQTPGSSSPGLSSIATSTPPCPSTLRKSTLSKHQPEHSPTSQTSSLTSVQTNTPPMPPPIWVKEHLSHLTSPSPASRRRPAIYPTSSKAFEKQPRVTFQDPGMPSSPPTSTVTTASPSASTESYEPSLPSQSTPRRPNPRVERPFNEFPPFSSQIHTSDPAFSDGSSPDFDPDSVEVAIVPWFGREDGLTALHGLVLLLFLAGKENEIQETYNPLGSDDSAPGPADESRNS